MLLDRRRRGGANRRARYSAASTLYSNSARDVIYEPARNAGGFDGVEQGLSCREPMRPRGYFEAGRRVARSYIEDTF